MSRSRYSDRGHTLVRVLSLWREIDGRRQCPRVRELADQFGVSKRTIYRDLEALEDAGYPVPLRYEEDGGRI